MKLYKVPVKYIFEGHYEILAESAEQAQEWASQHCGLVLGGNIHTSLSDDEVPDWNFGSHPEEEIGEAVEI